MQTANTDGQQILNYKEKKTETSGGRSRFRTRDFKNAMGHRHIFPLRPLKFPQQYLFELVCALTRCGLEQGFTIEQP